MKSPIAMAADSTQSDYREELKGSKRRRRRDVTKKKPKKSSKNSRRKKNARDSDSDCESDLDLSKELKPIGGYLREREETLDHMFRSISVKKLKAMLPEILKPIPVDDLKKLCLEQLECMSRKRIRRILEGADPETISSSGTEDESSFSDEEKAKDGSGGDDFSDQVADSTCQASLGNNDDINEDQALEDAAGPSSPRPESYVEESRSPEGSVRSCGSRSRSGSPGSARTGSLVSATSSRKSSCSDCHMSHVDSYSDASSQGDAQDSSSDEESSDEEYVEEVIVEEMILDEGEDVYEVLRKRNRSVAHHIIEEDSQPVLRNTESAEAIGTEDMESGDLSKEIGEKVTALETSDTVKQEADVNSLSTEIQREVVTTVEAAHIKTEIQDIGTVSVVETKSDKESKTEDPETAPRSVETVAAVAAQSDMENCDVIKGDVIVAPSVGEMTGDHKASVEQEETQQIEAACEVIQGENLELELVVDAPEKGSRVESKDDSVLIEGSESRDEPSGSHVDELAADEHKEDSVVPMDTEKDPVSMKIDETITAPVDTEKEDSAAQVGIEEGSTVSADTEEKPGEDVALSDKEMKRREREAELEEGEIEDSSSEEEQKQDSDHIEPDSDVKSDAPFPVNEGRKKKSKRHSLERKILKVKDKHSGNKTKKVKVIKRIIRVIRRKPKAEGEESSATKQVTSGESVKRKEQDSLQIVEQAQKKVKLITKDINVVDIPKRKEEEDTVQQSALKIDKTVTKSKSKTTSAIVEDVKTKTKQEKPAKGTLSKGGTEDVQKKEQKTKGTKLKKSSSKHTEVKGQSADSMATAAADPDENPLNQMEILELEMRARAIKAMLRKQEEIDSHDKTKTKRIKLKRKPLDS